MIERRWKPIIPHLREFQYHLADHVPQLYIESIHDRFWTREQYQDQCKAGVFKRYGVYFLFAPNESLEYIGVAMNSFDDRIWSHDKYVERRWTDVIPLAYEYYFLGLSLEFFMISRLDPPKNTVYRGYTIPEVSHDSQ